MKTLPLREYEVLRPQSVTVFQQRARVDVSEEKEPIVKQNPEQQIPVKF